MQHLAATIATFFLLAPVAAFAFSYTPIGRALVDRLRSGTGDADPRYPDLHDEIERLQDLVGDQSQRLEEMHDRLDFAERLLAAKSSAAEPSDEIATPA